MERETTFDVRMFEADHVPFSRSPHHMQKHAIPDHEPTNPPSPGPSLEVHDALVPIPQPSNFPPAHEFPQTRRGAKKRRRRTHTNSQNRSQLLPVEKIATCNENQNNMRRRSSALDWYPTNAPVGAAQSARPHPAAPPVSGGEDIYLNPQSTTPKTDGKPGHSTLTLAYPGASQGREGVREDFRA